MNFKPFIAHILLISCILYPNTSFSRYESNSHTNHVLTGHNDNKPIIAVVPEFFPPFYYTSEENLPYGMAIEVMNEIDHHAGYLTHYISKENWNNVFKAIDLGEAHIIPNLGITKEREKKYFFTQPYAKTDINVFIRKNSKIKNIKQVLNLPAGVVRNNVGVKIAKAYKFKNIHIYENTKSAIQALIDKKIDIIIYPKQIAIKTAKQLHQFHLIKDSEITLKVIHRAIAVDKRHPIIFKKLNTALNSYMKTQHYTDTYIAWYGSEAKFFTKTDLTVINILVLIFTVVIFTFFWRKKQFSIFNQQNQSNPTTWVVSLIAILVTVSSVVALITLWIIYETSFNEQQLRLIDNVKSRARLIEAVARHDQKEAIKNNVSISEAHNKTLNQVINAHSNFSGLGETGEFTLARKSKNEIEFIYRQRHSNLDTPEPISFQSELAIPMRLALFGHSGTIIGPDYRGENVLAAYEPVSILNLGIVAKIDLSEIREPFIRSALYILSLVILVSFLGSLLFFYIIVPVIQKMRETDQRFQKLFQENYSPILLIDPKSAQILDANKAAVKFYGYNLQELLSYNLDVLSPNPELRVIKQLHLSQKNNYESLITEHRLQNGEIRNTEILISPITINKKIVIQYIITDITDKLAKDKENKELQKELEQARKMEALGQLTGGIAHDFNNMLGIIIGYTDLTLEKLSNDPDNKIPGYLNNVAVASNRAKELIASMMLFSRTDEGEYQTLNISPLVKEDIKMLRSIIPTSIEIHSNINENLPDILIEPVKLQQLIMNLCVNARDAMDSEGSIVINLDWRKNVNNTCLISYEHITGDWIELSVTDTGSGMSKEVLQRLFEPFFTTKGKGKGTGMGMAVVHGIIKDIHAHILIDTEIGKGTRINVLFKPEENKDNNIEKTKKTIISKESHHERVLIVDDEESLSNLLGDTLESYNYRCTCFSSSRKALAAFKKSPDDFDLIISDQTMPALTGLELIKCMREIRPNIPAIIATGYSESINDSVAEKNNITLLKKPVSQEILLKTVSNILVD